MRLMNYSDYFDKVYGCLLGKTVIGTLGAPFEGVKMPLSLPYSPDMINTMLPNDDLDLQVLWLDAVEQHGANFTSLDLLRRFAERCPYDPGEYAVMRKNYARGIYPPLSGKFCNDFYINGMGSPIRSEIWACLAPLDGARAAEFAERDAVLDHEGDSVYAEQFFAALEAAAFAESDLERLIAYGLSFVPAACRFRSLVEDTVALCRRYDDERVILRKILFSYGHPDCTNLYENVAITLIALLKGEGDMIKTGMMALNCGFDTDCTCATAGAILGLILGAKAIEERYGWRDIRYVLGVRLERRSDRILDLAEDVALLGARLNPDRITNAPESHYEFAPSQYPLAFSVTYENDDPTVSPDKPCALSLSVRNLAPTQLDTQLSVRGLSLDETFSLSLASGEEWTAALTVSLPEGETVIRDKNLIRAVYRDGGGTEREFLFGVVGAMPWKVTGPIWRTDPICDTEQLLAAGLNYRNIVNAVPYKGNIYDVKRRFHLNFAIDTQTEYLSYDACFTPFDKDAETAYEETVFYQREDNFTIGDLCGFEGPAVLYLARELVVDKPRTVQVMIGHSAPFALWINGEKLAERHECDTFTGENVHVADLPLQRGTNRVLLRLTQVNRDAKYSLVFSERITCGKHITSLASRRPEFFTK